MKNLLFLICIVLLTSCAKDPISAEHHGEFELELLFEKGGCKMYRFMDSGRYIYWSNCKGNVEYMESSDGKGNYRKIQTIND